MACVSDVARFFIDCGVRSGEPVTNMRLNKLLYFAQGVHLARTGAPLFQDDFEAWEWGPVVPAVYHRYKKHRDCPIEKADPPVGDFEEREYASLLDTLREFGGYTTSRLMNMTHAPGGPWDTAMRGGARLEAKPNTPSARRIWKPSI